MPAAIACTQGLYTLKQRTNRGVHRGYALKIQLINSRKKMTQAVKKEEQTTFNADVSRLLDIEANALYTNHDVFLR